MINVEKRGVKVRGVGRIWKANHICEAIIIIIMGLESVSASEDVIGDLKKLSDKGEKACDVRWVLKLYSRGGNGVRVTTPRHSLPRSDTNQNANAGVFESCLVFQNR